MSEKAWKGLMIKVLQDKGFSNKRIRQLIKYLEKLQTVMSEDQLEIIYAKD